MMDVLVLSAMARRSRSILQPPCTGAARPCAARQILGPTALLLTAVTLSATALPSLAQPDLRSTFPGRRVGGATRGECSARLVAHLVPSNSVFSSGSSRLLGILEGPTANPVPLLTSFQPEGATGTQAGPSVQLPASGAGIILLRQPAGQIATRWESSYKCDVAAPPPSNDPLSFVTAGSPPALTLLLGESVPDDKAVQQSLQMLLKACGSSVPREEVAASFALSDVLSSGDWPARLPVRCPA